MKIASLLNSEIPLPLKPKSRQPIQYRRSFRPMNLVQDMLERIYQSDPCPSTELLQGLLKQYSIIPSLVYLRSWFNNRHNKHRRQVNVVRSEKISGLKEQCSPQMRLLNDDIIDLRNPIKNLAYTDVLISKLKMMQTLSAEYLDVITRFDGPRN
eukprot:NODE_285_length_10753_cov_0.438615.p8 type:complete len:154 gc:universal NODE_285_length_10753_cov_0.438615:8065-8526(+)